MFCGSFLLTEIVTNTKRVPTFWWRPDSVLFDLKILILMTLAFRPLLFYICVSR